MDTVGLSAGTCGVSARPGRSPQVAAPAPRRDTARAPPSRASLPRDTPRRADPRKASVEAPRPDGAARDAPRTPAGGGPGDLKSRRPPPAGLLRAGTLDRERCATCTTSPPDSIGGGCTGAMTHAGFFRENITSANRRAGGDKMHLDETLALGETGRLTGAGGVHPPWGNGARTRPGRVCTAAISGARRCCPTTENGATSSSGAARGGVTWHGTGAFLDPAPEHMP